MNSDDIYKFIGYAVVIIFGFYIVSKSLNFQFKMVENFTCSADDKEDGLSKEEKEKRKNEEIDMSKSINSSIKEIYLRNNKNLKQFKIIDKSLLEEYDKLIENLIEDSKYNIFDTINNKKKDITFNKIIDDLKFHYETIESLKMDDYLGATSGDGLNQKVENEPKEKEETDSEKTKREDEEKKIKNKLIDLNKGLLKGNKQRIKCIINTEKELQDSYFKILDAYKTEEIIYISDLILDYGEDLTRYESNMKKISIHRINIQILDASKTILTELFNDKKDKND